MAINTYGSQPSGTRRGLIKLICDDLSVNKDDRSCKFLLKRIKGYTLIITKPPAFRSYLGAGGFPISISECTRIQRNVLFKLYAAAGEECQLFYIQKPEITSAGYFHPITVLQKTPWTLMQEIVLVNKDCYDYGKNILPQSDERIYWLYKGSPRKITKRVGEFTEDLTSVWETNDFMSFSQNTVSEKISQTLIRLFSKEDDVIIDPYMKNGSVGVSARLSNLGFIGLEKNQDLYKKASKAIFTAEKF